MLVDDLLSAGLIQFGRFLHAGDDSQTEPIRFGFDLLPSYPHLLDKMATQMVESLSSHPIERLICTSDSLPFALTLSLKTRIPLVYSRGQGEASVYDLVGAYDIGHPTSLITTVFENEVKVTNIIRSASQVGLDIVSILAFIQVREPQNIQFPLYALFTWEELVSRLREQGALPSEQATKILAWSKL